MHIIEKDAVVTAPAWKWHGKRTVRMHADYDLRTEKMVETPSVRIEHEWWTVDRLPAGGWVIQGTEKADGGDDDGAQGW